MTNHPNRNGQFELEIWGGATAAYLARFPQRRFGSLMAVGRYMEKVAAYLDEMGVRAAHPMSVTHRGTDVTAEAWAAVR